MKKLLVLLSPLILSIALANHEPALSVSDQSTDNFAITLDSVNMLVDGFVVVHAYDSEGELVLTPPLGLAHVMAGNHENVMIHLDLQGLADNGYGAEAKNVLPMLHVDANNNGIYEFPNGGDIPIMLNGEMVVTNLAVTIPPSLISYNQTHVSGVINIDTVNAQQDGFVVIHAFDQEDALVLTPPLGLSPVKAGMNRHVTVELDSELLAQYGYDMPKNILPMLHIDANNNGVYEFPEGPDTPVMLDGEMVVNTIEVSQPLMMTPEVMADAMLTLEVGVDMGMGHYKVTIPSVHLANPGFVVLHTADADGNLVVLPFLQASDLLSAGMHENVEIMIASDSGLLVGDKLFAMLHIDNGDSMYTFPRSDGPVIVDGNIVMKDFILR